MAELTPQGGHARRLVIVMLLNLGLLAALIVVGLTAHSLGVLAEGVDYLADAAGVAIALWAAARSRRTGTARANRMAALINSGWLLALNLAVIVGAIIRLVDGTQEVHGLPVLIVSGIAAIVMTAGALLLDADDGDEDAHGAELSRKAILLDTVADAAAAAGVAVVGGLIAATHGLYWLDPAVALAVALAISYKAGQLLLRLRARP